jgi:hypothetical protein
MKNNSPFTPGSPVPVELFVGRVAQIREILQFVKNASYGKQENIFLTGERAIGKSSLASYIREMVTNERFLCIHVHLGGVRTVDGVVYNIFDSILKDTYSQSIYSKISDFFKDHIQSVDLFGINIVFNPKKGELEELKMNFPQVMKNIITKIQEDKKGIFIILDDIDGLAKSNEFADWYKSFVDYVATHYNGQFPLVIMPIGLPEQKDALGEQQASLLRIFRPIHVDTLIEDEVRGFFKKAFAKSDIKIEEDAMKLMIEYSSGLPSLMQEIGDAVYWNDVDQRINKVDAMIGIAKAADQVGQKYLNPKVYRTIRSDRYKAILNKIGREFTSHFKKKDIEKHLTESEKRVFQNFLSKMTELGVIIQDKEQGLGSYKFENELYALYIYFVSVGNLPRK